MNGTGLLRNSRMKIYPIYLRNSAFNFDYQPQSSVYLTFFQHSTVVLGSLWPSVAVPRVRASHAQEPIEPVQYRQLVLVSAANTSQSKMSKPLLLTKTKASQTQYGKKQTSKANGTNTADVDKRICTKHGTTRQPNGLRQRQRASINNAKATKFVNKADGDIKIISAACR